MMRRGPWIELLLGFDVALGPVRVGPCATAAIGWFNSMSVRDVSPRSAGGPHEWVSVGLRISGVP